MNETNSLIQIKGLRDGLLVSLDDAPWEDQRTALLALIAALLGEPGDRTGPREAH